MPPPQGGSPAVQGGRPRASRHPWPRAAGGCPPREKTGGAGSRLGRAEPGGRGADGGTGGGGRRGRRRAAPGLGPPLPSAWSSLNIHFMVRAGGKRSQRREARVRAGGGSCRAAGPVAVTVPVTTTTARARQAGLPARPFPSNRPKRSASGRGSEGRGWRIRARGHLARARGLPGALEAASRAPLPPPRLSPASSRCPSRALSRLTAALRPGVQRCALIGWRARSPLGAPAR